MACGTPVIAFPEGASEIVNDGRTGFLVSDEHEIGEAMPRLPTIEPAACRARVVERFEVGRVAAAYADVYESVAARSSEMVPGP
jgi:glycosyltransferase involved in cell wall biosynthesis